MGNPLQYRICLNRRGFLIPVAILAAVAVFFFIMSFSTMSRGYRNQIRHMSERQNLFYIAYSGYSQVISKLYQKTWEERFFKNGPSAESNVPIYHGFYDSYVVNVPGKEYQADIYIRAWVVIGSGKSREQLYFWRIIYNDDILDISNRVIPLMFTDIDVRFFPTGANSPFAAQADAILAERATNHEKANTYVRQIVTLQDARDIAGVFLIPPADRSAIPTTLQATLGQGTQDPTSDGVPTVFETTAERQDVTGDQTIIQKISPPVSIYLSGAGGGGTQGTRAYSNGDVTIEPFLVQGSMDAYSFVRLYDINEQEILFNGYHLLEWRRPNPNNPDYLIYKGVTQEISMTQAGRDFILNFYPDNAKYLEKYFPGSTIAWIPRPSPVHPPYTFFIRTGQKLWCGITGSAAGGYLRVDSPTFTE